MKNINAILMISGYTVGSLAFCVEAFQHSLFVGFGVLGFAVCGGALIGRILVKDCVTCGTK